MYNNFEIKDEVYMVMVRYNGSVYDKIIDGLVQYCGTNFMEINSMKNLESVNFWNGSLCGKDFKNNKYTLFTKKEDAVKFLKDTMNEYDLRKEVQEMISVASIKQLEAIYSYIIAERDRKETDI